MSEYQFLQPSWQDYTSIIDSQLPLDMDVYMGDCEFSPSLTTTEDSSEDSSMFYFPTMTPNELLPLPCLSDDVQFMYPSEQYSQNSDNINQISDEIRNVFDWMQGMDNSSETSLPSQHNFLEEEYGGSLSSSPDIISVQASLVFPDEDMEVDNQLSIPCLLKAYGEAIENEQTELVEVIIRRMKEKVSPMGTTIERVVYYFFQALDKQSDYLQQESRKNFGAAFRAFYQILPYGRFVHLTANLAILESIPLEVETLHIVDFDMGDGVQWPPFFEAIGGRTVRLTSIKWQEDCDSSQWSFQDTKRRLNNYAQSLSLKLEVEEMDIEELVSEMTTKKTMYTRKDWFVFNCNVGLPHMGRERSRRLVTEFLKLAKEVVHSKGSNTTRGIITLGEGDGLEERMSNGCGFASFLEEYLVHFHSLIQSMELNFPPHLADARLSMETLFIAPYISSLPCIEKWEENQNGSSLISSVSDLRSWKFSRENLMQAIEILKEGNSLYSVKIEGSNENLMSLQWRGTTLVNVSTWR